MIRGRLGCGPRKGVGWCLVERGRGVEDEIWEIFPYFFFGTQIDDRILSGSSMEHQARLHSEGDMHLAMAQAWWGL